jgi:hypothetical protein
LGGCGTEKCEKDRQEQQDRRQACFH